MQKEIKLKRQSLAERCEICHQSDYFDARKNRCSRCTGITITPTGEVEYSTVITAPTISFRERVREFFRYFSRPGTKAELAVWAAFLGLLFFILISFTSNLYGIPFSIKFTSFIYFVLLFLLILSAILILIVKSLGSVFLMIGEKFNIFLEKKKNTKL